MAGLASLSIGDGNCFRLAWSCMLLVPEVDIAQDMWGVATFLTLIRRSTGKQIVQI